MTIRLTAGEWKEISTNVGTVQNSGEYPVFIKIAETKPTTEGEGVELIPLKMIPITPEDGEKVFAYCEKTGFVEIYDPIPMVGYDGTKFVVLKANNGKLEVSGSFEIEKINVEQSDPSKLKNTELNSGSIKNAVEAIRSKQIDGSQKSKIVGNMVNVDFDEIDYTYNANQNPTKIEFSKDEAVVLTIDITYDSNENIIKIERS